MIRFFKRITLSIGGLGPVVLSLDTSPYCGWEETGLGRGQRFSTSLLLNRKLNPIPDREWLLYGLGLKLSDHHTRKHCIPCLHLGPGVTTQKWTPSFNREKLFLAPFVSFGKHISLWLLYYKSEDSGKNVNGMSLPGLERLLKRAPHLVSSKRSSWCSFTFSWKLSPTFWVYIPWTQGQCLIYFCILGV